MVDATHSVLAPAGVEAAAAATIAWVVFAGGAAVLALVVVLAAAAVRGGPRLRARLASERAIVAGGIALPVVALSALLVWGYAVTAALVPDEPAALVVDVVGEQWWWRVHYLDENGEHAFATANELHLPVGRTVELRLSTADVIHAFWVPALAGKRDMIPGRVNRLRLQATEPGVHRGQCAEYCGGAHARMAFHVVAESAADFEAWHARQRAPAAPPANETLERGRRAFAAAGCAACHSVRGAGASGVLGPDLTHVGGRLALAAGTLPNTAAGFAVWIASTQHVKPGNRMPPFAGVVDAELAALAAYLESLQ